MERSRLHGQQYIPQGLNRQGRIPFAAVIHQDICLSLPSHRFLHQLHSVSPYLGQLFHNLGVAPLVSLPPHKTSSAASEDAEL